jgi:drug/metabolite transporter (DMT)-like permease
VGAHDRRQTLIATVLLIALTAVWGSTFFLVRDLVKEIPSADFLAVRFAIAAALMVLMFRRQLRALDRRAVKIGLLLGVFYAVGQLLQTIGLEHTSASVSGFVTGMYVVFTPLLGALIFRDRITPAMWIAVAMSTAGLAVLALKGFSLGVGEVLTLGAAAVYGLHIVGSGRWARPETAFGLSTVQALVITVICAAAALPHGIVLPSTGGQWTVMLYMATASSVAALIIQTWAQAHMSATRAAVTMTMEPVFAAAFAVTLGGEHLTVRMVIGGLMILSAMYIVELGGRRTQTPVEVHHQVS